DVARSDPVGGKAAHKPRAAKKSREQRQGLTAPRRNIAALRPHNSGDAVSDRIVVARVFGGFCEVGVAAKTRDLLVHAESPAARRIAIVVERAVGHATAD